MRAILEAQPQLHVASVHVPGVQNGLADYLSRLPEPASGLNACILATSMALPTVRDVMRGSRSVRLPLNTT